MAKGKRRVNFTGVSSFLDALKTETASPSSSQISDSTIKDNGDDSPLPKKRKTHMANLLPSDSAYKTYDATGLVPFYTESSQVPQDLTKCAFTHAVPTPSVQNQTCVSQISPNGTDTSPSMTRAVSSIALDGTALPRSSSRTRSPRGVVAIPSSTHFAGWVETQ